MRGVPVTFAEYVAMPSVNWSTLRAILRSPLHYQHALAHPMAETPAMRLGSAVHCAVLEPDVFPLRYVVVTPEQIADLAPPRNTREGRAAWAAYLDAHPDQPDRVDSDEYQRLVLADALPGKVLLAADTYDRCLAIRDAVQAHPAAGPYVAGAGANETVIAWDDPAIGRCKGRLDRVSDNPPAIVDLKTSRDIDSGAFGRQAAALLWHAQLAWYQAGWKRATGVLLPCVIVAVENTPPYDVALVNVDEDSLEAGRDDVRRAISTLAECRASGEWPGRYPSPVALQLPSWVFPGEGVDGLGLDFGSNTAGMEG